MKILILGIKTFGTLEVDIECYNYHHALSCESNGF